jgi:hypothetical protein
MFVIAYDLTVADAEEHHPRSYRQAYLDIESAGAMECIRCERRRPRELVQCYRRLEVNGVVRAEREEHTRVSDGAGVRLHGNREGAAVIEIISGAEAV